MQEYQNGHYRNDVRRNLLLGVRNPQLVKLQAKTCQRAYTHGTRKRLLDRAYDEFIIDDAKESAGLFRKAWMRGVMPDPVSLRRMAFLWDETGGKLESHNFVGLFRTDRDTLGYVFEDVRGLRSLWTVDLIDQSARRLGDTL